MRARFRSCFGLMVVGGLATSVWLAGTPAASAASGAGRERAASVSATAAGPGAPTAGDSLFPDVGNSGYDVANYRIGLTYHRSGTISATTRISAKATKRLTSYTLDLEGLTVSSVSVNGHRATWSRSGHKLKVTPFEIGPGELHDHDLLCREADDPRRSRRRTGWLDPDRRRRHRAE